jgi:hypothetical protein
MTKQDTSYNGGINHGMIMKTLDYVYEKAVNGIPGFETAESMAEDYIKNHPYDPKLSSNKLVRWQIAKAGTAGFLSGIGGIITLPVAIPANMASTLYIQTRMIAAIAVIGGHDVRDDRVKTLIYMCLTGSAMSDIAKDFGIKVGAKFAENAIKNISGKTITKINQAIGFRLITKFGTTGAVNLGKMVPLLGGMLSGCFDSVTTKIIGEIAIKTFI